MKITTTPKILVSSSFTERFGNEDITPAKTVPGFKTLEKAMNDCEIKAELDPDECTLEDVAAFLKNPPKGTDDGNWNIFYVRGLVVGVYWRSGGREWLVYDWGVGGSRWAVGLRVFSRNWLSKPLSSGSSENFGSLTLPTELEINGVMYRKV